MLMRCVYTSGSVGGGSTPPAPPPGPGPGPGPEPAGTVEVAQSVDVYSQNEGGGQVIGILQAGTAGVSLVGACRNDWCHVRWPAGEGYVYDGPGYDSLKY